MKRILIIMILILAFAMNANAKSWVDNWTVNGIPVKRFVNAEPMEYVELGSGMLASFAIHWLGHVIWLELNDKPWKQDGLTEVIDGYLTDTEANEFGNAGFLAQCLVGTAIKFTDFNDTMFSTGYHIGTFLEISTYPLIHGNDVGDIGDMDRDGNGTTEHLAYTAWSTLLLIDYKK